MPVPFSSPVDDALRLRLQRARDAAVAALLAARAGASWWTGELSASALSTATAVTALTLVARHDSAAAARLREPIRRGFAWLIAHQNADGGWGDTTRSFSNISTTALAWAALGLGDEGVDGARDSEAAAGQWLARAAGSTEPEVLVAAIERRYGADRTFSIPILMMCALCGRLGPEREGWGRVRQLPFELAALPQGWFGALRLPVVSYALPALIAIGQVRHGMRPTTNPLLRWVRNRCRERTLEKLRQLQPENGGFLEAAPLTSFVTMSLAALGHSGHPVARRGVAFLAVSARPDGSWPIDTNLATWLTTLSVNALVPHGDAGLAAAERTAVRDWLLGQQHRRVHPYTLAAPGGWAWTDLPGGVPDADDTAGAVLALTRLDQTSPEAREAVRAGVAWLVDLQNRDGGIPTFCRGWGRLPFDRSSPDITAHAIRAWLAARDLLPGTDRRRIDAALARAMRFLRRTQRPNGTWIPLWFGHQEHPDDENPLYGTTRVLLALLELEVYRTKHLRGGAAFQPPKSDQRADLRRLESRRSVGSQAVDRALVWLVANQNADGGWGGAHGAQSSVEETGLAVEALAAAWNDLQTRSGAASRSVGAEGAPRPEEDRRSLESALRRGAAWLAEAIEHRRWEAPAPIGFYFAKLWYFERLYPLVFATAALTRLSTRLPSKCSRSGL